MILAAGRGTRLGSLGLTSPKVLVEIGGEPLLGRHLRFLAADGFRKVVVNAHHLADQVALFVEAYRGPLEVEVVREPVLLGTAGGVRNALDRLGPEPFAVIYGDVFTNTPLIGLVRAHDERDAEATIALFRSAEAEGKGVVGIAPDGRVRSFVEKGPASGREAVVNAGIYVLDPAFVEATTEEGAEIDFGHDVFPAALASGRRVYGHVLAEPVIDVGTPEGLRSARALVSGAHGEISGTRGDPCT
jgi:mannose-1-phosphate guanylyltransferase